MRALRPVALTTLILVFAAHASADIAGAIGDTFSSVMRVTSKSFSVTKVCGPQIATELTTTGTLSSKTLKKASPKCVRTILRFRAANKEFGARKRQLVTAVYENRLIDPVLRDELDAKINEAYEIKAFDLQSDSVEISGRSPGSRSAVFIYVQLQGLESDSPSEEPAAVIVPGTSSYWRTKVYFRSGPGNYKIKILKTSNYTAQYGNLKLYPIGRLAVRAEASMIPELLPSGAVQSTSLEIDSYARAITHYANSKREAAQMIHEWVSTKISYDDELLETIVERGRPLNRPVSAVLTLRLKRGVCTDFAVLTVALLRSVGIPARVIAGAGLSDSTTANIRSWATSENHTWVEAFIGEKWIVMDPTFESAQPGLQYFDTPSNVFARDHRGGRIERNW